MSISTPDAFGRALVAALGLPKYTTAIDIRVRVGQLPTVEVEFYPDEEWGTAAAATVAEYELVPREPHPLDAADDDDPPPAPLKSS